MAVACLPAFSEISSIGCLYPHPERIRNASNSQGKERPKSINTTIAYIHKVILRSTTYQPSPTSRTR